MSKTTSHVKEATSSRPEFFRLPRTGGDPYFGLTRPHYYELEKLGKLKLTRLRKPGTSKGVTLVPYAAVLRMLTVASSKAQSPAIEKKGARRR